MGGALIDYVGVDQQLIRMLPFVGGADTVVLRVSEREEDAGRLCPSVRFVYVRWL